MQTNYICHHGILGQRWGVRRYQNKDGTLTSLGKQKYGTKEKFEKEYLNKEDKQKKEKIKHKVTAGKVAAVAIGLATAAIVGGAIAYNVKKRKGINTDSVIKAGTEIQRITYKNEQLNQLSRFYGADDRFDKIKYAGLLANARDQQKHILGNGEDVVKNIIKSDGDLKIAGKDTGKKVYESLMKNPSFPNYISKNQPYDEFVRHLVDKSPSARQSADMFFSELRKQGYGGIKDTHDMFGTAKQFIKGEVSGYNANNPVIFFNSPGTFKQVSQTVLNAETIKKGNLKAIALLNLENLSKDPIVLASITAAGGGASVSVYKNSKDKEERKEKNKGVSYLSV